MRPELREMLQYCVLAQNDSSASEVRILRELEDDDGFIGHKHLLPKCGRKPSLRKRMLLSSNRTPERKQEEMRRFEDNPRSKGLFQGEPKYR